ncbi:hypothetical protein [Variovorax boronicumulans]
MHFTPDVLEQAMASLSARMRRVEPGGDLLAGLVKDNLDALPPSRKTATFTELRDIAMSFLDALQGQSLVVQLRCAQDLSRCVSSTRPPFGSVRYSRARTP